MAGPSKAQVNCTDNRDGTCTVDYVPTKPGDYDITVKFADQDIPGWLSHANEVNFRKCYDFIVYG